jgi:uncharacterized Tic20 family protein
MNSTEKGGRQMDENEEKKAQTWGMLCHLTALSMFIGLPFGNLIGPLVIWLIKKNDYPLVDEQGKESLNFQLSMTIYSIIAGLLCFIFIGFLLLGVLVIVDLILVIKASVRTSNGQEYLYPYTIRFLK